MGAVSSTSENVVSPTRMQTGRGTPPGARSLTIQVFQQQGDGGGPPLTQQRVDVTMQDAQETQRGGPAAIPQVGVGRHGLREVKVGALDPRGHHAPQSRPPGEVEAETALRRRSPQPHGEHLRDSRSQGTGGPRGAPRPSQTPSVCRGQGTRRHRHGAPKRTLTRSLVVMA